MDIEEDNQRLNRIQQEDLEQEQVDDHPLLHRFYNKTFEWAILMFIVVCILSYLTAFSQSTHFMETTSSYNILVHYNSTVNAPTFSNVWTYSEVDFSYDCLLSYYGLGVLLILFISQFHGYYYLGIDPLDYDFSNNLHLLYSVTYIIIYLWLIGYWLVHGILQATHLFNLPNNRMVFSGAICFIVFLLNLSYFAYWVFYLIGLQSYKALLNKRNSITVIQA